MSEITRLRVEDIHPNPRNNRQELRGIPELAANMAVNGQLDPIIVVADGGMYWIVSGHRRHAAAMMNGWEHMDARVAHDWDDAAVMQRIVAGNDHDPITPIERSMGVQEMLLLGVPIEAAAASSGETAERISQAASGIEVFRRYAGDEPEQTSIDRFIALADLADDEAACRKIMTASEASWPQVVAGIRRARKLAEKVEAAKRTIEEAGVELLTLEVIQNGPYHFMGCLSDAPDGAQYAIISAYSSTVAITWYSDAASADDAAQSAERAERERIRAELESEHARRLAFLHDYLAGVYPRVSDELLHFASAFWESDNGPSVSARSIDDALSDIVGFAARVYAAILSHVEDDASRALWYPKDEYYAQSYGTCSLAYFDALQADGYEFSELEAERLVTIKRALGANDKEAER